MTKGLKEKMEKWPGQGAQSEGEKWQDGKKEKKGTRWNKTTMLDETIHQAKSYKESYKEKSQNSFALLESSEK